jgi:hypothetical protein
MTTRSIAIGQIFSVVVFAAMGCAARKEQHFLGTAEGWCYHITWVATDTSHHASLWLSLDPRTARFVNHSPPHSYVAWLKPALTHDSIPGVWHSAVIGFSAELFGSGGLMMFTWPSLLDSAMIGTAQFERRSSSGQSSTFSDPIDAAFAFRDCPI